MPSLSDRRADDLASGMLIVMAPEPLLLSAT
jgi:hypothetical protein